MLATFTLQLVSLSFLSQPRLIFQSFQIIIGGFKFLGTRTMWSFSYCYLIPNWLGRWVSLSFNVVYVNRFAIFFCTCMTLSFHLKQILLQLFLEYKVGDIEGLPNVILLNRYTTIYGKQQIYILQSSNFTFFFWS